MLTGLLHMFATLDGAVIGTHLAVPFYGLGVFTGTMVGWAFVFFQIRWVERNFEGHIFCRYKIIDTMKSSEKGAIIYRRGQNT